MFDGARGRMGSWVEQNQKYILIVGGGAFAFLAVANFSAAITVAVILGGGYYAFTGKLLD